MGCPPVREDNPQALATSSLDFVLANSADPDEMTHYAAFYLGLHCLPHAHLGVSVPQRVIYIESAQWLSGRVLDWRLKGRGLEPHRRHCVVVLEQDTILS